MKTYYPSEKELQANRKWYVLDIAGKVLGRQATGVATVLRGKHKPEFTPFLDAGDYVIIINAEKVELTGLKMQNKMYYSHSGFPGGIKECNAARMREKTPELMVELAIKRMLPKGVLGKQMLTKLKIYRGSEHPHASQKPENLEF